MGTNKPVGGKNKKKQYASEGLMEVFSGMLLFCKLNPYLFPYNGAAELIIVTCASGNLMKTSHMHMHDKQY